MAAAVSVIVPFYNAGPLIGSCVEALLRQRHDSFEVIAVDDASSDEAWRGIPEDPRVRVLRLEQNGGPGAARNRGLAVADGDLIVFLDADSLVEDPQWLNKHVAAHEGQAAGIVGGGIIGRGEGAVARADAYCHWFTNIPESDESRIDGAGRLPVWRVSSHLVTNNISLLRSSVERIGPFDEAFRTGEDVDFCARAVALGLTLRLVPSITVLHFDRERLSDFFRCFYKVGRDRVAVWRKHRFRFWWALPRGRLSSLLLLLPLTFVLPIQPILAWWPSDRRVALYLPLIMVGCLAVSLGLVAYFWGALPAAAGKTAPSTAAEPVKPPAKADPQRRSSDATPVVPSGS